MIFQPGFFCLLKKCYWLYELMNRCKFYCKDYLQEYKMYFKLKEFL